MQNNDIILVCSPLIYYSDFDEMEMFQWLDRIKCIKSYKGIGPELLIYLKTKNINFKEFIELEAIFKCYLFDIEQLSFCRYYEFDEDYIKLRKFRNDLIRKNPKIRLLDDPKFGGGNF